MKFTKIYIKYKDKNVLKIYDRRHKILYYNVLHSADAKIIILISDLN